MKDVRFTPSAFNRDEDIFVEEECRETVTFALTDEEILKAAKQTTELDDQYKDVNAKFSQVKKDFSGKLKGIEAQINYNFQIIKDQAEDREVDCVKRRNFTRKIVQFLKDGVVIKERPMSEYESTHPMNVKASLNSAQHVSV